MKWAWCAGLLLAACGPTASVCGPRTAKVVSFVDGDTFELDDGRKIRLLLVDTPEITKGKNDCYGQEAADFTRAFLEGKTVQLTYDEAECLDRYQRTLAFVAVDGKELNQALARQGYACELYVAPGGQARHEEFLTYVSEAQTNRTGMWGTCSSIPCSAK